MKSIMALTSLMFLFTGCGSSSSSNTATTGGDDGGEESICPDNFVYVDPAAGYTESGFCIAKYESKDDGSGNVVIEAAGLPYVDISQEDSVIKCQDLGVGYDLITNDEWQTVAQNIELVSENWDGSTVGSIGGLNRGHSDGSATERVAASTDDQESCFGTGQVCNGSTWNILRRIHILSSGDYIWDFAGNVFEWVKDTSSNGFGASEYVSQITDVSHPDSYSLSGGTTTTSRSATGHFGPSGDYSALNTGEYGGLGYSYLNGGLGAIARGGAWGDDEATGIFATQLNLTTSDTNSVFGFRCVYHP